jgi:hypothetical protein
MGYFFKVQSPAFTLIELERQKLSAFLPSVAVTFLVMDFVLQSPRGFFENVCLETKKEKGITVNAKCDPFNRKCWEQ